MERLNNKKTLTPSNGGGSSNNINPYTYYQKLESRKMDLAVLIYRLESATCAEEHAVVKKEFNSIPNFERLLQHLPGERIIRYYKAKEKKFPSWQKNQNYQQQSIRSGRVIYVSNGEADKKLFNRLSLPASYLETDFNHGLTMNKQEWYDSTDVGQDGIEFEYEDANNSSTVVDIETDEMCCNEQDDEQIATLATTITNEIFSPRSRLTMTKQARNRSLSKIKSEPHGTQRLICRNSGFNQFGRPYNPGIPLDLDTRQQIVKLFQKGVKVNAIAKQLAISHGCVSKILSRFRTTGQLAPPKQLERLSTGILKSDENSVSLPIECVNESNEGNADANTEDCEKPQEQEKSANGINYDEYYTGYPTETETNGILTTNQAEHGN